MLIKRLKLSYFRNYELLDVHPEKGLNILAGDNAQGKTNAAEAIFLCAFGRSHRTPRDQELIMTGCAGGYAGVEADTGAGSRSVEMKLSQDAPKKIFVDRLPIHRSSELMGVINVVMFSPEELALVKNGPAERRRFMDMEISQLRPSYYTALQNYNRALRHRNALLKEADGLEDARAKGLDLWTDSLIEYSVPVMTARRDFMERLSPMAMDIHRAISGGREELVSAYQPDCNMAGDLRETLSAALARCAQEDARRGYTTRGCHRDDIALTIGGEDIRAYGSQGQKRTAALSLKLSEIELIRGMKKEPPILILDDVLSELDENRQRQLLMHVEACQTFLTCAAQEQAKLAGSEAAAVFRVQGGSMVRA